MTTNTYSAPTKIFHWLTVILLVTQYAVGWLMPGVHRGTLPVGLISWHVSIGAVILLLVLVRLVWHWIKPSPPPLQTVSPLLQKCARATHALLYLLLVAFPLMGWANASVRGWSLTFFDLVPLPSLVPKGSPIGHAFGELHTPFAWVLCGVITLHIMATLYHYLVVKDDSLRRMLA
ncbi:MAG TPA: cytochrome b/b6 domain-containing protein [Herbaspirillum sp.]|nr:cytochrome b/b6 domain-containing protein [Herbaspirillum sp.]